MKLLIQILANAVILFLITYLLWPNESAWFTEWVSLWCSNCDYFSFQAWKIYLLGWIILGWLNALVRPILKILTLPLYFVLMWAVSLIINAIVLKLLWVVMNDLLQIPGFGYEINGVINFVIAVAIFTFLNTIYSILFAK